MTDAPEPTQSEPVPDEDNAARVRRRRLSPRLLLPAALGVLALVVGGIMLATNLLSDPEEEGLVFVIPAGAADTLDVPTIDSAIEIPTDIRFGPDDVAIITVRNEDSVANRAGPWVIGAGQTYTARFDEPGVYNFTCTVDESESVTVTVLDDNGEVPGEGGATT
jgi:hypothetical protein